MLKNFKPNYHNLLRFVLVFLFLTYPASAYVSEKELQTVIVGKLAKYISWHKEIPNNFVIVVLKNQFGKLFDETYLNKRIKSKPVKIKYITNINQLNDCEILFISKANNNLNEILKYTKNKNILTISPKRGFAQKGGDIQLYFVGQLLKLKINIDMMQKKGFKVDKILLRVVNIVKSED